MPPRTFLRGGTFIPAFAPLFGHIPKKADNKGLIFINDTITKKERAILAGLSAACMDESERSNETSMLELEALVETAGGEVLGTLMQSRETPDPRSFIGEGKVQELKELVVNNECDLVVFDNELSPSQMRVLSKELDVKVLDRSGLILDIFAQRAQTREGQLQVELAQYVYLLPRLTGMWTHLTRQTASGGSSPIGTRGPGETQLETDRRHIRRKIQKLRDELEQVRKVRGVQRRRRERNAMPVVAIVGYTNAGKSSLLNSLTGSEVPANNRLFDTLDTTTRRLRIDESREVLLSDTVGFIRKLPTHLVEAFKATLEELQYADVLLHVIDVANPDRELQIGVVEQLIAELGAGDKPCIRVYNKCDVFVGALPRGENSVCISARTGEGEDALIAKLGELLGKTSRRVTLRLPYDKAGLIDLLRRECAVLSAEYTDDCILADVVVKPELWGRVREFAGADSDEDDKD
ncbi:MAG: GTPase HflX [Oscillospiraceae bacterium]